MTALRQSPVTYDIPCPLGLLSPQDDGGRYRHYHTHPSEHLFPSDLHHRPSMSVPNSTASTTSGHSNLNSYYPRGESLSSSNSRPSMPPPTPIAQPITQSENAEKHVFGYAYQAPIPMNTFTPGYSTSYPLNSGYTPIAPPLTLAIPNSAIHDVRISSIPERSNGVQYPLSPMSPEVESLTTQNYPTSYVRRAVSALGPSNVTHKPIHHYLADEEMFLRLQMLPASQPNPIWFS